MSIVLTFDDGYLNTHDVAFPIMQRRDLVGTLFVITGLIGGEDPWHHRRLMERSHISTLYGAGWDIESHGVTHTSFMALTPSELVTELAQSKDYLRDWKGGFGIAYPYGEHDNGVISQVKKFYGWGRMVGGGRFDPSDPYHIPGLQHWRQIDEIKKELNNAGDGVILIFHEVDIRIFTQLCDYISLKIDSGEIRNLTLKQLVAGMKK